MGLHQYLSEKRAKWGRVAPGTSLLSSPCRCRLPQKRGALRLQPWSSLQRQTPRWREVDSNCRSHLRARVSLRRTGHMCWQARSVARPGPESDAGRAADGSRTARSSITRAAPLFSTRLRWLCPATTRSFTRGPLASSLVMSASYQTDQNRKRQGPSHLPSSKRGDALSLRRCSWMPSNPCRPCPPYRRPAAFRRPPWVPACRPPCPRW